MTMIYPIPMIGMLIQNIHRQVTKIISQFLRVIRDGQTILRKSPPYNWTRNRPDGPHARNETAHKLASYKHIPTAWNSPKPFPSFPQRHHISNYNLSQRYDTSRTDTLKTPTDKHHGEVLSQRSDDGANRKERQGHICQRLSAKDMRKRCIAWLKYC